MYKHLSLIALALMAASAFSIGWPQAKPAQSTSCCKVAKNCQDCCSGCGMSCCGTK